MIQYCAAAQQSEAKAMAALSTGTGENSRRVWPVEKYARLVSDTQSSVGGSTSRKNEGIWQVLFQQLLRNVSQSLCLSQHYSSKEGGIHLAVIDSSHLMISSGTMIFVSDTQVVCSNVFTHVCLGEFLFVGC